MTEKITPFKKNGRYTDIRVGIRELLATVPNATSGIIILFDPADDNAMYAVQVCARKELAYAGAVLSLWSTEGLENC